MNDTLEPKPQPVTDSTPRFGIGAIVRHPLYGTGRIVDLRKQDYVIAFTGGNVQEIPTAFEGLLPMHTAGDPQRDLLKKALAEVLGDYGWLNVELEMGKRWQGGILRLLPGKEGTQTKDIPLELLFSKLIGIRDKLRVLEMRINSNAALTAEEKLDLQGYLTRCYGSLTTFNVLFAAKESGFAGQSGKE